MIATIRIRLVLIKLYPSLVFLCIKINYIPGDSPLVDDCGAGRRRYKWAAFADAASDSYLLVGLPLCSCSPVEMSFPAGCRLSSQETPFKL